MSINERISDSKLSEKLQMGDVEAFDLIFNRYSNKLFGFALKYLKSKEETEGLVQDVFLKVWENRKNLKKESSLKAYLFTIAYHNMCQIFRRRQIYLKFIEKAERSNNIQKFEQEEKIEYEFTLNKINVLINMLPEKQRAIFIKSRKEGKSTREIAKEMNLAPGTIDNNISLALKFLRKMITSENLVLLLLLNIYI